MKNYEKAEVEVIDIHLESRNLGYGVGEGSTGDQFSPRRRVIDLEEEN